MNTYFAKIRAFANAALHWWTRELASALPWLATAFRDPRPAVVLQVGSTTVRIAKRSDDRAEDSLVLNGSIDSLSQQDVESMRAFCEGARTIATPEPAAVMHVTVPLQRAAHPSREQVSYELLRLAPIKIEGALFNYQLVASSNPLSQEARAFLCRREYVMSTIERLRAMGVEVDAVDVCTDLPDALSSVRLWEAPRSFRLRFNPTLVLAAVATVFPVLSAVAVASYATIVTNACRTKTDELSRHYRALGPVVARVAHWHAVDLALNSAQRRPSITGVLDALAGALPLDASLTEFRLEGDQVRLVGSGPQPAAAVKALTSVRELEELHLATASSATTGGHSQFEIAARVGATR